MGTLVCFHAHPDDESIGTGGTLARAKAEGHRTVLVVATNGDHGEVPADLAPGETLVDRRRVETERSAAVLGIDRLVWLDYTDSGMTGWEQNDHHQSFLQAPLDEAAALLADVLRQEDADVLVVYDWHGVYGHPDHVKVHHVGHRAAEMVGGVTMFEVTMNRDAIVRQFTAASEAGERFGDRDDFDPNAPADDGNPFGEPESAITHAVDVTPYLSQKRESMRCHASQLTDTSFFITMPDDIFAVAFGTEWFIKPGADHGLREGWLFE